MHHRGFANRQLLKHLQSFPLNATTAKIHTSCGFFFSKLADSLFSPRKCHSTLCWCFIMFILLHPFHPHSHLHLRGGIEKLPAVNAWKPFWRNIWKHRCVETTLQKTAAFIVLFNKLFYTFWGCIGCRTDACADSIKKSTAGNKAKLSWLTLKNEPLRITAGSSWCKQVQPPALLQNA